MLRSCILFESESTSQDPPGASEESKKAYDDFLKGLDLVNQQEYVYASFAKDEKISKSKPFPEDMFKGIASDTDPMMDSTWYHRATWERQVTLTHGSVTYPVFLTVDMAAQMMQRQNAVTG